MPLAPCRAVSIPARTVSSFAGALELATMGVLVEGVWHDRGYEQDKHDGRFERDASKFRNWVKTDGEVGPGGIAGFKAEAGRYHLYAAYFCPWAHRTLIMRKL